ncbi:MAG: CDP-alcohol phosphatidyltransferase, partial [bacterium]
MKEKLIAWGVQAYTALGLVTGILALRTFLHADVRGAFLWLAISTLIDGTDGPLARRFRTPQILPGFNGRKLDDIVDYVNYVFIPVLILVRTDLLPAGKWAWAMAPLLASAYGFCQEKAKTDDGYFTGFPSYWNIVVLYLYLFGMPAGFNLLIVLALSLLAFIPIKFIDPFKTKPLAWLTRPLTVAWAASILALILLMPNVNPLLLYGSFLYPCYYFIASFWINARIRSTTD